MPVSPFHRILVGWDASPAAHLALATALTLAHGDGVVIVRAVLTPSQHAETGGEQHRDLDAQRRWLQEQYGKSLKTAATHGARVRLEWGENPDIPDDLHACARNHSCDLIVLGCRGVDSRLRTGGLGPVASVPHCQRRLTASSGRRPPRPKATRGRALGVSEESVHPVRPIRAFSYVSGVLGGEPGQGGGRGRGLGRRGLAGREGAGCEA